MHTKLVARLNGLRKALLAAAACATIAAPVAVGLLTSPHAQAQTGSPETQGSSFTNVSIQLASGEGWSGQGITQQSSPPLGGGATRFSMTVQSPPPPGNGATHFSFKPATEAGAPAAVKVELHNVNLRGLIASAYGVADAQVVGRDWAQEPKYNVTAYAPVGPMGSDQKPMLRELLTKYFGLIVKVEPRQMDGYLLTLANGGPKLTYNDGAAPRAKLVRVTPDSFDATNMPLSELVKALQMHAKAPVVDQTGLQGNYDYKVSWPTGESTKFPDLATIAKGLEEQLGLHLEARPLNVDVIDVVGLKSPQEVVTN